MRTLVPWIGFHKSNMIWWCIFKAQSKLEPCGLTSSGSNPGHGLSPGSFTTIFLFLCVFFPPMPLNNTVQVKSLTGRVWSVFITCKPVPLPLPHPHPSTHTVLNKAAILRNMRLFLNKAHTWDVKCWVDSKPFVTHRLSNDWNIQSSSTLTALLMSKTFPSPRHDGPVWRGKAGPWPRPCSAITSPAVSWMCNWGAAGQSDPCYLSFRPRLRLAAHW